MTHRTGWRCRDDLVRLVAREIEDGMDSQEIAERAVNTVGEFVLDEWRVTGPAIGLFLVGQIVEGT